MKNYIIYRVKQGTRERERERERERGIFFPFLYLKHVDFFFCGGVLFDFIFEVVREK